MGKTQVGRCNDGSRIYVDEEPRGVFRVMALIDGERVCMSESFDRGQALADAAVLVGTDGKMAPGVGVD